MDSPVQASQQSPAPVIDYKLIPATVFVFPASLFVIPAKAGIYLGIRYCECIHSLDPPSPVYLLSLRGIFAAMRIWEVSGGRDIISPNNL